MFRKAARGFTLIELMIVVAIIGILAAIAIPNFLKYQLRTKRSEGSVNVAGIRTSEISYQAANDTFMGCTRMPAAGLPGAAKVAWGSPAGTGFDEIAWQPEGSVYFIYTVITGAAAPSAVDFTAVAWGNVDGGVAGEDSCWVYGKPAPGVQAPPAVVAAACAGTVEAFQGDPTAAGYNVERVFLATPEDEY